MNKYLVSVIIPVFNCEKYLKNSINSLISQTIFEKIEFIFVNDGSTDNSLDIICSYVDKYENFKVYSQINKGVSAARNLGISKSIGDYICFFDADDEADPNLYEILLELITEYSCDISVVDYSMIFDGKTEKKHRPTINTVFNSSSEMLKSFFSQNLICNNPFDKMFRREIIKNIKFPEGYAIGEDMFFVYKALLSSSSLVLNSSYTLYKYILHPQSAMKSSFSEKYFHPICLSKKILDDFEKNDEMYCFAEANYIHEICKMVSLFYKTEINKLYLDRIFDYRKILKKYSIFKAVKYMDKKHVVALELMKISPYLYNFIYKILKVG